MKVFDIRLDHRDMFIVYFRDNQITLVTDKNCPFPRTSTLWDKATNTFSKHPPYYDCYDKVYFPTYAIPKEDINDFFTIHIMELIKYGADQGILKTDTNILILTKECGDVFEVGFGLHQGEHPVIHQFAQTIVDRYMKLKVFW